MDEVPAWLEGARLAPSAHNTQPWRFAPLPNGHIRVRWDPDRALPESDPTGRDLLLGLGAAVEAACLESAARGHPLRFVPDTGGTDCAVGYLIEAEGTPDPTDLSLARSLRSRHTARVPHLRRPIPPDILTVMHAEADRAGCRLSVVTDARSIRRLASLARQATAALYADPIVHRELWQWLRLDPHDPAYCRDGLTADCLELRGLSLLAARLLLPPQRMNRLVHLGVHHLLALDTQRVVKRSTSLCLLTVPSTDRDVLVAAGRTLLRLWLVADAAGLSTHPVSALLDHAAVTGPALEVFDASGMIPAAVFRLGACPPVARAPRLPADDLLEAPE